MRLMRFKKDREIVIREYRLVPRHEVEVTNVFIDRDSLCDECEFRYDCPVARTLRKLRRCY